MKNILSYILILISTNINAAEIDTYIDNVGLPCKFHVYDETIKKVSRNIVSYTTGHVCDTFYEKSFDIVVENVEVDCKIHRYTETDKYIPPDSLGRKGLNYACGKIK